MVHQPLPIPAGAVDFTGATSVDFTGATITGTSFLNKLHRNRSRCRCNYRISKVMTVQEIFVRQWQVQIISTTVAFADPTGKPTPLAGYGITDALALAGGALTGSSLDTNNVLNFQKVAIWSTYRQLCPNKQ